MIIRKGQPQTVAGSKVRGPHDTQRISDAGGLTQYGAYVETLRPGDAACWPAGVDNAHQVVNHTDAPCTYLICSTRVEREVVHYPELGQTLYIDGRDWRILGAHSALLKEGVE